jgi:formate hydrogenlyase subunit 3/multisubunit Na+/H+ antiporter MnhD subunit
MRRREVIAGLGAAAAWLPAAQAQAPLPVIGYLSMLLSLLGRADEVIE